MLCRSSLVQGEKKHKAQTKKSFLSPSRRDGKCIREYLQRPIWQEGNEDPDGRAGCCWKDYHPIQT